MSNHSEAERDVPNALSGPRLSISALGSTRSTAAFTLVELLVGMSLALMVMTAVLTTYVTLGRNFTRTLGLTSANQSGLNSQMRRTLAYFIQDVRMASGFPTGTTPSASSVTLSIPSGTGTKQITYYYNSTPLTASVNSDSVTINGSSVAMRREALTRCVYDGSTVTSLLLQSSLLSCAFSYYDASGRTYVSSDIAAGNYLNGVKMLSLSFTCQAGSRTNGTLTQIYNADSPRVIIRNKTLLP